MTAHQEQQDVPSGQLKLKTIGRTGAEAIDSRIAQIVTSEVKLGKEYADLCLRFDPTASEEEWSGIVQPLGSVDTRLDKLVVDLIDYVPKGKNIDPAQRDAWKQRLEQLNHQQQQPLGLEVVNFGMQGLEEQLADIGKILSPDVQTDFARMSLNAFRKSQIDRLLDFKERLGMFGRIAQGRKQAAFNEIFDASEKRLEHMDIYPDAETMFVGKSRAVVDEIVARALVRGKENRWHELTHHVLIAAKEYYERVPHVSEDVRRQRIAELTVESLEIRLLQMDAWQHRTPQNIAEQTYDMAKQAVATAGESLRDTASGVLTDVTLRFFIIQEQYIEQSLRIVEGKMNRVLYSRAGEHQLASAEVEEMRKQEAWKALSAVKLAMRVSRDIPLSSRAAVWGTTLGEVRKNLQGAEKKLWWYIFGSK